MTGNLRAELATVISTKKVKESAKRLGVTFNDFMMGLSSSAIKLYFDKQGDKSEYLTVSVPFTFHTVPKDPKDYTFGNNFVALPVYMPLIADFKKACLAIQREVDSLKNSLIPVGCYTMLNFYNQVLPAAFAYNFSINSAIKHSLFISNIPAYTKPVTYAGGGQAKRFYFLGTGPGVLATSISIVSVCKRVQVCVTSDESQIEDIESFIGFFNQRIQELGIAYDAEEEGDD